MSKTKGYYIQEYFRKFPLFTLWLIPLSILLLTVFGLGVIGLGISIYNIYKWNKRTTDTEFDKLRDESLRDLKRVAMSKLRLEESDLVRDFEFIVSPKYWNIGGAEFMLKKGKDGIIRYTPINVSIIFFTEHKLCIYQCVFDMVTGNPLNVSTDRYFYTDIVSIKTQSINETIDINNLKESAYKHLPNLKKHIVNGQVQINSAEYFVLVTTGGTAIKIQLPNKTVLDYGISGRLNSSRSDQAIASVEAMVDNKKAVTP